MIWSKKQNIINWLPRLQGHRGYWCKGATQNTLESIAKSYELHYEMTEFDVRLTQDGVVILFHDVRINNKKIRDYTFAKLKETTSVNTLDEVLQWLSQIPKFKLNIEIKSESIFDFRLEEAIVSLIKKYNVADRVLVSSFNPFSLFKVRILNSNIYRALLFTYENENGNNFIIKSKILNLLAYPDVLNIREKDYLRRKKKYSLLAKKVPIVLWTVNDIEIWRENKSLIHGIISDTITPAEFKN